MWMFMWLDVFYALFMLKENSGLSVLMCKKKKGHESCNCWILPPLFITLLSEFNFSCNTVVSHLHTHIQTVKSTVASRSNGPWLYCLRYVQEMIFNQSLFVQFHKNNALLLKCFTQWYYMHYKSKSDVIQNYSINLWHLICIILILLV